MRKRLRKEVMKWRNEVTVCSVHYIFFSRGNRLKKGEETVMRKKSPLK